MSIERVNNWWIGKRTVIVNVVSLITMVIGSFIQVEGAAPSGEEVATFVDQGVALGVGAVNVINLFLRWLTKTPVFTS